MFYVVSKVTILIARELGDIPALFGVQFCIVMGMSDGVERVRWSLRSKAAGAGRG